MTGNTPYKHDCSKILHFSPSHMVHKIHCMINTQPKFQKILNLDRTQNLNQLRFQERIKNYTCLDGIGTYLEETKFKHNERLDES